MDITLVAAAILLVGGAAAYAVTREGIGSNAAARRALGLGGWAAIALGSLGMLLDLGPVGGVLLALSVLGLSWIACALTVPVSARAAGLLTACAATVLVVWGVAG